MNQEYKMKLSKEQFVNIYNNEYLQGSSVVSLAAKYNVTPKYIYRWFALLNLPCRSNKINSRKYKFNDDYFQDIDTSDKAYWLGFIYADGYIQSKRKHSSQVLGISLKESDKKHLEKFNDSIDGNIIIRTYTCLSGYGKGSLYSRITVQSQKMVDDLKSHGVIEHKSNILKAPNISSELEKDFIRGYFDGDGSVWVQNKKDLGVGFVGTKNVLMFIQDVLIKNNVIKHTYPLTKRKEQQEVFQFKFGGNIQVMKFLTYIYADATLYLERKFDFYQKQL